MKKRMISLLLILSMVVPLLPSVVWADGGDIGLKISSYTNRYEYDHGLPINFGIVWEDAVLEEDTHYTINYWDAQDNPAVDSPMDFPPGAVGDYQFIITGLDPYTDSFSGNFCIYDPSKDLSYAVINLEHDYPYTGQTVVLKDVEVTLGSFPLYENYDYTISYKDENGADLGSAPTDIGDYYAVFKGMGLYSGEKQESFSIKEAKSLISAEISLNHYYAYTGAPVVITGLKVEYDGVTLIEGTDYTVKYFNDMGEELSSLPSSIGQYQIQIVGKGLYTNSYGSFFLILDTNALMLAQVSMTDTYVYTGSPVEINDLIVTLSGSTLKEDIHYTVSYANENWDQIDAPTAVGNYYLIIVAIGPDYTGFKDIAFSIIEDTTHVTNWADYVTTKPDDGYSESGSDITISTAEGLAWLISVVNGLNGEIGDSLLGKTVTLTEDINLSAYKWTPIGESTKPFSGTFEGNNCSISSIRVEDMQYAGLFGYSDGNVQNLTVSGSVTANKEDVARYAGGIVGYKAGGTITNCHNTATITASGRAYNGNNDIGRRYAGGAVGYNYEGTVENCSNTGDVTASGAYNMSNSGYIRFSGGLVGLNEQGKLINSSNKGTVTGSGSNDANGSRVGGLVGESRIGLIENCSNTGDVTARDSKDSQIGGLVGYSEGSIVVRNCSNTGDVTASCSELNRVGGLVGESTGLIENCSNTGDVTAEGATDNRAAGLLANNSGTLKDCSNTGNVTAHNGSSRNYAGGLVDRNAGTVENCFNTGAVTARGGSATDYVYAGGLVTQLSTSSVKVINCYNTGDVTASGGNSLNYVGGLLGYNHTSDRSITNCYWLNTSAERAIGDGIGDENCSSFTEGQGWGIEDDLDYTINTLSDQGTLSETLNAWVGVQTTPSDYLNWINPSEKEYPILYLSGIDFTVIFNANGGTVSLGSKTITSGNTYGDLPEPTRSGYTFDGWFTEVVGGDKINSDTIVALSEEHTLYAHWTAEGGIAYKVEYYQENIRRDGYDLDKTEDLYGITDTLVTATQITYTGFTENTSHPQRMSSGTIAADGSLVLKLYYDRNLYTVSFVSNGGTPVAELSIPYGAGISKPDDPSRSGYRFLDWYKNEGLTDIWNFDTDIVALDTTLYAKWKSRSTSDGGGFSDEGNRDSTPSSSIMGVIPSATPDQPNPATMGIITPTSTVDENGRLIVTITEQDVKDAIQAALDLAKRSGVIENGIAISIDFSGLNTQFNTLPLTLTKGVYQALVDAGVKYMQITTPQISLSLDLETLKTILQNMGDQITIMAEQIDPTNFGGMTASELGSRPAYKLTIAYGNKNITEFGEGWITVSLIYTPSSSENSDGLYAIYVDDLGNLNWIWDSDYRQDRKTLEFRTNHFSIFGIGYKEIPSFTDTDNHWAKKDIEYVALRGLMRGTSSTTFSPQEAMTRGMFVTVLGKLANVDNTKYKNSKFIDIEANAYYGPYVAWASEKGITSGTSAITFSPDKIITRQEMAVLLVKYAKAMNYTLPQTREEIIFADDAYIDSFAKNAVKIVQMAGIISGKDNKEFDPQGIARRAEAASILRRYNVAFSK